MNPGELRERVGLYNDDYSNGEARVHIKNIWARQVIKNKRFDGNEQSDEFYYFIARKNDLMKQYIKILHRGRWYDVLTVDTILKDRGYIEIKCILSRVHIFHDTCTVTRLTWEENEEGEMIKSSPNVYSEIPCQLIVLKSGNANQTESKNDINQFYRLELETKYQLKIGDKLTIKHQIDLIEAEIESFYRYQTHQEVVIKLKGDA